VNEVLARVAAAHGGLAGAHHVKHHGVHAEMGHVAALIQAADVQRVDEQIAVPGTAGHREQQSVPLTIPAGVAYGPLEGQRGPVAPVQAAHVAVPIVAVPLVRLYRLPGLVLTAVDIVVAVDRRAWVETAGAAVLLVAEQLEWFCKPPVQVM
jgi:hypothetical protein